MSDATGGVGVDWPVGLPRFKGERLLKVSRVPWRRPPSPLNVSQLIADNVASSFGRFERNSLAFASEPALEPTRMPGAGKVELARDALIISAFAQERHPQLNEATVRRLAQLQGTRAGSTRRRGDSEQIGRIPLEMRPPADGFREEMSTKYGWEWPYFGAVDTTPLFISAAIRAERFNPGFLQTKIIRSDGSEVALSTAVGFALSWVLRKLRTSRINLLETMATTANSWQVWQNSPDAYHHKDGRLARGLVASVEVQGWAYDALMESVELLGSDRSVQFASRHRDPFSPNELRREAQNLRDAFFHYFWIDGDRQPGYLAAGVETFNESHQSLGVRNVNMGIVLRSRLLDGHRERPRVDQIIEHLLNEDLGMMVDNGIRSLGPESPRFRVQGNHVGAVQPGANYAVASSLVRRGEKRLASEVRGRIDRACRELNCTPGHYQGTAGRSVKPVEAVVEIVSPDGNGGEFEHTVMQPAQIYDSWTMFAHEWSRRQGKDRPIDADSSLSPPELGR